MIPDRAPGGPRGVDPLAAPVDATDDPLAAPAATTDDPLAGLADTPLSELRGTPLGERTVSYTARDAILYALAVGASREVLDLVFEDRLRALPTFGLTLAQWAPDVLASRGLFGTRAVHGSQSLDIHAPLPPAGEITLAAHVGEVWDKGSAAVIEVTVDSRYFTATWSIFAPGMGGFNGERGPRSAATDTPEATETLELPTFETQAALYRLTGDLHHIHIDPAASAKIGQPTPILQGLATLAAATLPLAAANAAHAADLTHLSGRFSGPVVPGETLSIQHWGDATALPGGHFCVEGAAGTVISGGSVGFG